MSQQSKNQYLVLEFAEKWDHFHSMFTNYFQLLYSRVAKLIIFLLGNFGSVMEPHRWSPKMCWCQNWPYNFINIHYYLILKIQYIPRSNKECWPPMACIFLPPWTYYSLCISSSAKYDIRPYNLNGKWNIFERASQYEISSNILNNVMKIHKNGFITEGISPGHFECTQFGNVWHLWV